MSQLNVVCDIANICKKYKDYREKVAVHDLGVDVYLEYDPDEDYKGNIVLPIFYDTAYDISYIPDDEYRKLYNTNECGITREEVEIALEIMGYMESHKKEINELCNMLSVGEKSM